MKGQFFVIATVIMVYTLVLVIQYIYDFSDIRLTQLEEMGELDYIEHVKEVLTKTASSSYNSSYDCSKVASDMYSTKKFLEEEMIKKGVNLTIIYDAQSCPSVNFNFSLRTPNLFTTTEFAYSYTVPTIAETRYFRAEYITVNGLDADALYTTQGNWVAEISPMIGSLSYIDFGIKVWKRNSTGFETNLTGETPVAIVRFEEPDEGSMKSAIWSAPLTSLNPNDSIVIRTYLMPDYNPGAWDEMIIWTTPQLEATQLNATTWTVYYYGSLLGGEVKFYYNDPSTDSRIENFAYLLGPDMKSPTYSNQGHNTTIAGQPIKFSVLYSDNRALQPSGGYIFSTNNTGTWVVDPYVPWSSTPQWANVSKILTSTAGQVIGYRWYVNDSAGNRNDTPIFTLTTTKSISFCGSFLDQPGITYYLDRDIINSAISPCINITADNVTLDCQGYTIDGDDLASYGIYAERPSTTTTNITIKNCVISDWYLNGIRFGRVRGNTLNNLTVYSNWMGIAIYTLSDNNQLTNIIADSNTYGIYLSSSNNNTITSSKIQNNSYGISLSSSGSTPNKIYNNLFNNTRNFYFETAGTVYNNSWNTTKQTGQRIYSPGAEIGGNYWTNSTKNGYSDTCTDSNRDGFCDSAYILNYTTTTNNTDYLPLSNKSAKIISFCSYLTEPGETYYLDRDIINSAISPCIFFSFDNTTLDCQGHTIDGDGLASYGIYMHRELPIMNNTIKNCTVTGWNSAGIYLENTYGKTIENINARGNYYSLHLINSSFNKITNITADNNAMIGLFLTDGSNFNTLKYIKAESNYRGLVLAWSDNNTLINVTANYNFDFGFQFYDLESSNLTNLTSKQNNYGFYFEASRYNIINDSRIEGNRAYGIYLISYSYIQSSANKFYNNLFNQTNNIGFSGIYANSWNTTNRPGTRVVGSGNIGGNYWTNSAGNGYSDICQDTTPADRFCDNPYNVTNSVSCTPGVNCGNNVDYLPYRK